MSPRAEHLAYTEAELARFASAFNESEMMKHFGLRLSFPYEENKPHVRVMLPKIIPAHRGGMGTAAVNGGILAAMADFSLGCTSLLVPPLRRNATIQVSLTFERPTKGNSVRCDANVDRPTKNALFSSARLFDEEGNLCARASAIVSLGPEISLDSWANQIALQPGKTP